MLARAARSHHVRSASWEALASVSAVQVPPAPLSRSSRRRRIQQAAVPDPVAGQEKLTSPDLEFKAEEPFVVLDRRGEFFYEPVPCVESRHPTSADGRANMDDIDDLLYL